MDNTSWVKKYDTDAFVYTKDVNQFVVELCGPLAPGKAIDVAGGEGRNGVWLAEQGWQVAGTSSEGLANRIKTDTALLGGVIAMRGIKAE